MLEAGAITAWKLFEQPAIIGTQLLGYLMVINGKVRNLSEGPGETRMRIDGLVLVGA